MAGFWLIANCQLLPQNVGYNGMPTDSEPLISAIGAVSNGITE
jgi:hypothetical protein